LIRELRQVRDAVNATRQALQVNNIVQINRLLKDELAHNARYRDSRKLNHHEFQAFSQNGEDGIIAELFRRLGIKSRFFVEVGVGNGLENNTAFLLTQGWRGCWVEGDAGCHAQIRSHFRRPLSEGALKIANRFVTAENIEAIFSELTVPAEFDLLSLDIDRNTYHIWKALARFKPRVVVVEYNATFPPDVEWAAEYNAERSWNYTAYFGASLKTYERLGESLGYALVGCDFSGTNAFFVRREERLELFAEPFTSENHYEPPRYWSVRREAHPRCFQDS
jgi:hypothetical protein